MQHLQTYLPILWLFLSVVFHIDFVLAESQVLRVGHFPNLTHAAALVVHANWRKDAAAVEAQLGKNVKLEWYTYNAGPSAMEALIVGALDLVYVGPNPALNAYARSQGAEVRILAGSTFGGAALLVQGNGNIKEPKDFRGKRIGTPQLGNTQDIAARAWLLDQGIKVTQTGGEAQIVPAENPDLFSLFSTGQLDAVWTVEPWVSRLEREAKAKVHLAEADALTTILVGSVKAISEKSEQVNAFLKLHQQTTDFLNSSANSAKVLISSELEAETTRAIAPEIINSAWTRMRFSSEISNTQLEKFVASAQRVGFLKEVQMIAGIMHVIG